VPAKNALDTAGVHIDDADLALPLSGDTELGQQEATSIHHRLTTFGNHVPKELPEQHYQLLDRRIGSTGPTADWARVTHRRHWRRAGLTSAAQRRYREKCSRICEAA
jgi:hypothetical protein